MFACEQIIHEDVAIARFKHMSGEFPTASAFAFWLACHFIQNPHVPLHMIKKSSLQKEIKKILVYNNFKGAQHSFMLVSKV